MTNLKNLSKRQKEILVGLLLGDGHLETRTNGRTYRLKIEQSLKHKEYVDWLYEEFKECVQTPPQEKLQKDLKRKAEYNKYWFNTLTSGIFRFYAHQFYKDRIKVVPKSIAKWLTPLSIAVWYMDNGSIKYNKHRTVIFNTHGFKKSEINLLISALDKNFGIKAKIRKQNDGLQIYLLSETIHVFQGLVDNEIHASMRYKLPKTWLTNLPKM